MYFHGKFIELSNSEMYFHGNFMELEMFKITVSLKALCHSCFPNIWEEQSKGREQHHNTDPAAVPHPQKRSPNHRFQDYSFKFQLDDKTKDIFFQLQRRNKKNKTKNFQDTGFNFATDVKTTLSCLPICTIKDIPYRRLNKVNKQVSPQ